MLVKKLATVLLVFGFLGIAHAASAQDKLGHKKDKTIAERLDNLGKILFGEILSDEKPKTKEKDAAGTKAGTRSASRSKSMATEPPADDVLRPSSRRAGSVLAGSVTSGQAATADKSANDGSDFMPENTPPAVPRAADAAPKPVRRPLTGISLPGKNIASAQSKQSVLIGPPRDARNDQPALPPLHKRLTTFRQSVFGSDDAKKSRPEPGLAAGRTSKTPAAKPAASALGAAKPVGRPTIAQRIKRQLDVGAVPAAKRALDPERNAPVKVESTIPAARKMPMVVRNMHAVIEQTPASIGKSSAVMDNRLATLKREIKPESTPELKPEIRAEAAPERDGGLRVTRRGPVLSVETLGPRRITVGKESAYEVGMVNLGEVAAEELVVFVSLPEWAEVAGAEVTSGTAQTTTLAQAVGTVQWKLGHLDAKGRERMTLRIIPRQSRPFDLVVRWDYRPVASQAMIEVQEAKLSLQLEGPREVLYGKKETYRLRVANFGNGDAENVAIMLMPIGGGENMPATHKIGVLPAGEEKALDVELTARQAGNLTIQVDARAEGGVHAELAEKVLVRRAGLKIDVDGPKMQFMGVPASYVIRVRNPGTASARNIRLSIRLPAGGKYLSGLDDARLDASGNTLKWTIESLGPEVEQSFGMKCLLGSAGANQVQINASAEDDLTASAGAMTRAVSVANLTMEVVDPEAPVAVGEEATYEVRVRNRGTKEAGGIEVFVYFSRGIEPTGAEGGPNRVTPGQVTFQPIASLAPGATVAFKVRARAEAAGNHIFRAEAHCQSLGTRLIREATNLYYTEGAELQQAMGASGGNAPAPEPMRTVTRPVQGEKYPAPRK
jgi:hypothetical protein